MEEFSASRRLWTLSGRLRVSVCRAPPSSARFFCDFSALDILIPSHDRMARHGQRLRSLIQRDEDLSYHTSFLLCAFC